MENRENNFFLQTVYGLNDYLLHIAKIFYVVHELCYELITNCKNLAFFLMQVF